MRWSVFWPYAHTWWGTFVGGATILYGAYYGLRKMLETWDWYIERFTDSKVCQFLKDNVGGWKLSERFGENQYVVNYWKREDIAKALRFGERRVEKSLDRLKRQGRAELMREGWVVKSND